MGTLFSTKKYDIILQRIANEAPTEIARYIFEIAASEDRHTAASLRLVSKQISSWVEQYHYRFIILDSTDDIVRFNDMMRTRGPFLREHLRTLSVFTRGFVDTQIFGQTCSNVHTLHAFDNARELEDLKEPPPNLKQFTYSGFLLQTRLSNIPFLQSVTHLAFPDDVPHDFADTPSALPNLTHFACRYSTSTFGETPQMLAEQLGWVLERVLQCPRVQLVLIVVQDNRGQSKPEENFIRSDMLREISTQISDPRVVFWVSDPEAYGMHTVLADWDLENPASLWEEAGKKLSQ